MVDQKVKNIREADTYSGQIDRNNERKSDIKWQKNRTIYIQQSNNVVIEDGWGALGDQDQYRVIGQDGMEPKQEDKVQCSYQQGCGGGRQTMLGKWCEARKQ